MSRRGFSTFHLCFEQAECRSLPEYCIIESEIYEG